ncbi:hypothetical protein PRIPAC_76873 [Pristionchus pacificus]|uniref:Mutator-like transposase domain-containing protein n=1 Tax=Pristionchus pacificus TaxID=54126 RepID=A0A2A6CKX0_PRIPA|nr:hypothetical protein PRIPAC_76873 [Pristionchus pacificus]|eukprot:PDM78671.1 hypothetical protein PRIPAC_31250 [Pristionchus pacificus]
MASWGYQSGASSRDETTQVSSFRVYIHRRNKFIHCEHVIDSVVACLSICDHAGEVVDGRHHLAISVALPLRRHLRGHIFLLERNEMTDGRGSAHVPIPFGRGNLPAGPVTHPGQRQCIRRREKEDDPSPGGLLILKLKNFLILTFEIRSVSDCQALFRSIEKLSNRRGFHHESPFYYRVPFSMTVGPHSTSRMNSRIFPFSSLISSNLFCQSCPEKASVTTTSGTRLNSEREGPLLLSLAQQVADNAPWLTSGRSDESSMQRTPRADTVLTVIGEGERYFNMQEMSVLPRHYEPMTPPHGYSPQLNYASVEGADTVGELQSRSNSVGSRVESGLPLGRGARLKLSPAPLAAVEDDDESQISYSQIDMLRTQSLREFIELIFFSMLGVMRKKKCFLCGEEMIQARNFPPLSKPLQRKEWILRQDRDDEGTRALIEKHDAIKDPRWCVRHFADPSDSLPIDKRIVPTRSVTIPTVPLRTIRPADLVPPSQFHIEPLQLNNFESRRDDIIADSYHIPKSPTILGSKRDQPWLSPLALEEEYSWNDINIDYTISKKFKKEVSTKTTTTIATEGTEYRYSQDSQLEEEDIEIEGEEMENESSTEMGKYAIVEDSSLKRLFKRCEECGASLDTSSITIRRCGSARIVSYHCINEECNAFVTWESQEKVGQGRGKVYSANHKIPVAAFVTGMPFPRFIDFGKLLDIDLPCDSSLRRNMREYGGVAIERVFEGWQEAAREIAVNASEGRGLQVSIDGQYDSPGYTASNCKVTIIDCETKLALAGIALHKDEDGIDGISCRMESEGALRGLVELIEDGIEIRTRVGDQNGMVNKKLREHPLTANIENLNDWWHVQRPLRKEWWQVSP